MKLPPSKQLLTAVLVVVVTIALGIATGVLSQKKESKRKARNDIPVVFSKVRTLQIIGTKIIHEGTSAEGVSVEILNNSDKAVMAVDLVCGNGAVTKNGLTDEANPIVVIKPHGTTTIEMGFSEMTPNEPLVVSAVTYSDGTEEGDAKSLKAMELGRKHDREMMKQIRGNQKP